MILVKTDKARASLLERRALSPRERQLLVLADGRRDKHELARLLGFDIREMATRMVFDGYLTRRAPSGADAGADGDALAFPASRRAADGSAPRTNRSLAASKMYVIGLMQMLRDADAAMLAVSLHGAQNAEELRHWLVASLVFIHDRSGPEYAGSVTARLMEVLPLDELPDFCDELAQTALPAIGRLAMAQQAALAGHAATA